VRGAVVDDLEGRNRVALSIAPMPQSGISTSVLANCSSPLAEGAAAVPHPQFFLQLRNALV
jgi:hypothetical protein